MKTKIIVFISLLVLFLVSFRSFLFLNGSFGHNWDWSFPNPKVLYNNFNLLSFFTWKDFNLGWVNDLTISHLIQNETFGLLGLLVGSKWLIFTLFFFVILISFYGFKRLLDFLITSSALNYIPALLYAFSPFLFNDIIGGSWPMWLSYALAPSYFRFLVRYYKESQIRDLICFILISTSVMISLQNFVLINVLVFLYLFSEILQGRLRLVYFIKKTVFLVILLVLVNSYWILPFSPTFINFSRTIIFTDHGAGEFDPIRNSQQSIWNIFSLVGYLDRNMYFYSIPVFLRYLLRATVVLVWSFIFAYFIAENKRARLKKSLFWLLSLMLLVVIVKGGNLPFEKFTVWLYESVPFLKLFRSPQHLMLVPAFIIPILMAFGLRFYFDRYKQKKFVIPLSLLLIFVWISGWWYNGDLGMVSLIKQGRDHIDFYQLPPELTNYYERAQVDKQNYRSFFLPSIFSPFFLETKYQRSAQGVQPEYMYLTKPTFVSDANRLARVFEESFCNQGRFNYLNYLSLFSVKNIIVRTDIEPTFSKGVDCLNGGKIKRLFDSNPNLNKFATGEYLTAYQIDDNYFLPFIFVPKMVIISDESIEKLGELVSRDDYQIGSTFFFTKQNDNKSEVDNLAGERNDNVVLEYKKINPTKYRVRIHNAKGKFPLVLSQNFNRGWKLYLTSNEPSAGVASGESFDKLYETWLAKPLGEDRHFVVNGYANGWLIDSEKLCAGKSSCNLEVIIEFQSQKLFYIGLFISSATLTTLLVYWLTKIIKR